jgi:phosphatidylglycerophosphatase A
MMPPRRPALRLQAAIGQVATGAFQWPRATLTVALALLATAAWTALPLLPRVPTELPAWPLAAVLLGAWLTLRFRQPLAVAVILGPLALLSVGLVGFLRVALGGLTPLADLGLALVLGLGCRQGAELYDRFQTELARGRLPREALHIVWHHTGLPSTLAATTALTLFFALGVSPKPVLRDCGLVVGVGLIAAQVAHASVLPALLALASPSLALAPLPIAPPVHGYAGLVRKWAPALVWLSVLATLLAVSVAPRLSLLGPLAVAPPLPVRVQGVLGAWPALVLGVLGLLWLLRDAGACALAVVPVLVSLCGLAALAPVLHLGTARFPAVLAAAVAAPGLATGLDWALASQGARPLDRTLGGTVRGVLHGMLAPGLALLAAAAAGGEGVRALALPCLLGLGLATLASVATLPAVLALLEFRPTGSHVTAPGAVGPGLRTETSRREPLLQVWRREALATVGLAGYAPFAAGTFGALVAMPVAAVLSPFSLVVRATAAVILTLVSVVAADRYLRDVGVGETGAPPQVVVDEFAGCLIALVCIPWQPTWVIVAFVLFRVLDVWQPWPVQVASRFKGGWGVVGDDVVAGLIAGGVSALARVLFG